MATIEGDNLTERLVTREHTVQGLEFLHCVPPQRVAFVFLHERAEPFAQRPRLRRHSIQFSWDGALLKACTHRGRNEAGGGEPRQQILARFNPLHRGVDRCRERIEKIEGARVRNEKRCGPLVGRQLESLASLAAAAMPQSTRALDNL